jgi:hypothetical protein
VNHPADVHTQPLHTLDLADRAADLADRLLARAIDRLPDTTTINTALAALRLAERLSARAHALSAKEPFKP